MHDFTFTVAPSPHLSRRWVGLCVAGLLALQLPSPAQAQSACGDLQNAYGPWDYRKDRGEPLRLVESAHFNAGVESLIRGQSTTQVGGDIDYTLRAFPNHHRALISAARLGDRLKTQRPPGMQYTIECYFDRAVRFKGDDVTVRMIFARWLTERNRRDEAMKQLRIVDGIAQDNPFTRFNLGLSYFELKEYDAALKHAHEAIGLGFPRPELKERLQSVGKWSEPPGSAASAAAGAVSAASSAASN